MPCQTACLSTARRIRASRPLIIMRKASSRAPDPLSLENAKKLLSTGLSLKDIPGPPSFPFIGSEWQYIPIIGRYKKDTIHESYADKFNRYGPVVREEFVWGKPVIHLYDPKDYEQVLKNQGPMPTRPISEFVKHYRRENPDKYDSPGLANSVGDEWLRIRKVLGPVLLQLNALDGLIGDINSIADDFVTLLRAKRHPEFHTIPSIKDYFYRLGLESIYLMSLDSRLGCLEPDLQPNTVAFEMIEAVKLLFEAFQKLYYAYPLWKILKTPAYRKLCTAESAMYKATNDRVHEAMRKLKEIGSIKTDERKPSILETLLKTMERGDKEIKTTVIDFISGGIFTVTNSFTFLLHNMAQHPDVQEKLYEEVTRVAPDGVITNERLKKMPYLKACVRESFRFTPTIPLLTRILSHDIKASGYHIPAGTAVFCHFPLACKDPQRFPNPDSFIPERWLDRSGKPNNNYVLIPFGFGARMCVGRRFAEMQLHTNLAKLVYNFKMETTTEDLKCKQVFIVVPGAPVSLTLKDR